MFEMKWFLLIFLFVLSIDCHSDEGCRWFDYMEQGMLSPVNDNSSIIQMAAMENEDGHCSSPTRNKSSRYNGCKWYYYMEHGMLSSGNDNSDILQMAAIENVDGHCSTPESYTSETEENNYGYQSSTNSDQDDYRVTKGYSYSNSSAAVIDANALLRLQVEVGIGPLSFESSEYFSGYKNDPNSTNYLFGIGAEMEIAVNEYIFLGVGDKLKLNYLLYKITSNDQSEDLSYAMTLLSNDLNFFAAVGFEKVMLFLNPFASFNFLVDYSAEDFLGEPDVKKFSFGMELGVRLYRNHDVFVSYEGVKMGTLNFANSDVEYYSFCYRYNWTFHTFDF